MRSSQMITNLSDATLAEAAGRLSSASLAAVMRAAVIADEEIVEAVLPTALGVAFEAGEISINKRDIVADPSKAKLTPRATSKTSMGAPVAAVPKQKRQSRKAAALSTAKDIADARARDGAKTKGVKRKPEDMAKLVDSVEAEIKRMPAQGVEQIAKSLNASTKELTLPIRKLLADKKITSKGQKRATRYFPS